MACSEPLIGLSGLLSRPHWLFARAQAERDFGAMRLLTRQGYLIEEPGMTTLADTDPDLALGPLQAAACTYRVAFEASIRGLAGNAPVLRRLRRSLPRRAPAPPPVRPPRGSPKSEAQATVRLIGVTSRCA